MISIWNLEKRKLQTVVKDAHDGPVVALHFLAREPVLLSSGADNSIKVSFAGGWYGREDPVYHLEAAEFPSEATRFSKEVRIGDSLEISSGGRMHAGSCECVGLLKQSIALSSREESKHTYMLYLTSHHSVCAAQMWIFDTEDGEARLLRFRNGHSSPPSCVKSELPPLPTDHNNRMIIVKTIGHRCWHTNDSCSA